ncbi:hypothetical protein QYM36_012228 [Artemia franciscana]|uniref:Centromere protein J C-terminal domain-containing protein n=1 Tax=Artemia franciscana TaxID=6661 RepID=A0AA88HTY1_ARTSF|nr:hypothetical protein QYM36_012228 [Artemia franciscana]
MTEGSTSTPQASTAKKLESTNQDESRHVRFADSFKYAEYTLEADSDSDTMVTSYGVDEIESDDPSRVKTVGDTFASDIVQKIRTKFDNTAESMITHADSYFKMKESDKENTPVQLFCDKNSAAITKVKVTSGMIVSPPPSKRGLTPSNPIWEAFKDQEKYNNEVSEVLKEIQCNTDDYNGILKQAGLIGIENNNTPAATTAIHSRILELEKEINVFRKEANRLRKSRKEADELKSTLTEEKNRFEKQMENEKRRWQLQLEEEKKKLKSSEKRKDETSQVTDEVMELKNKLEELTNVTRTKESKWFAEKNKLLSRIRYLESQLKMKTDEVTRLSKEEHDVRKKLQSSLRPRPIYAQVKPQSASIEVQTDSFPSPSTPCKVQPPSTPIGTTPQLKSDQVQTPQSEKKTRDGGDRGKVVVHEDGTKEIIFESGNIKTIFKDGIIKTVYFNKDVKIVQPDGTIKYIYTAKGITQTTMNDGKEVLEYPEGHVETKFPSGKKEVKFPDGCFAVFHNDGSEERQWPNGTKLWRDSKGNQMMQMPNGDRETSTPTCKIHTSYSVDEIESDDQTSDLHVKTVADVFVSEIVERLRKKFDSTAYNMISNSESYVQMTESDRKKMPVQLMYAKKNAAISEEKVTRGIIVSPPLSKRGSTLSNPIWGAFNKEEYNNQVHEVLKEIQCNTDNYNRIMKHVGLIGMKSNSTPAVTAAIY